MRLEPVTDRADERLADFLALTDVALRRRLEPAEGLFIAEGATVIRRSVAAGYAVRAVLCEQRWVDGLRDVLAGLDVPVLVAPAELLTQVTGYPIHRGALASMQRRPLPAATDLLRNASRVAVLEDIVSTTNVGAVFRSAAALGVDAVMLSPGCADPLYRRALKVSMGTTLAVPYARLATWPEGLAELRTAGFTIAALTPSADAVALPDVRLDPPTAVLIGTEGEGLSAGALAASDLRVRIPMAAGVDSLNAAAAAAVAFYALAFSSSSSSSSTGTSSSRSTTTGADSVL